MKKRIFLLFLLVCFINSILSFLLFFFNELSLKEDLILFIGSLCVYFILNLYLYFQKVINNQLNYSFVIIIGIIVSIVALIILSINVVTDKILFFPMMYVISMFFTFLCWYINDKAKDVD